MDPIEQAVLERLGISGEAVGEICRRDQHSNLVCEVRLMDGRILVIKSAADPSRTRFGASRIAAGLVLGAGGILAPRYLDFPDVPQSVLVYWWLPWPTLGSVWRDRSNRTSLARSWGRMVRRLHGIPVPGHGPLKRPFPSLQAFLTDDLGGQLGPPLLRYWPAATAIHGTLLGRVHELPSPPAVFVHNDLFDRNVLCDPDRDAAVGILDLEDSLGGPPEADLAKTELLHGPLFRDQLDGDWYDHLLAGWGGQPDPRLLSFFRSWSLLHMGLNALSCGYEAHAADVLAAAAAETKAFGSGRRHRDVIGG